MKPWLRRRVTDWWPDSEDNKHRWYSLECGHSVRRELKGDKRYCRCGYCEAAQKGTIA